MMPYLVGYAQRTITPELPIPLAGYDMVRLSNHVHDPLYAKVIVVQNATNKEERTVMIGLDTYVVDASFTTLVAKRLARHGFSFHQLILAGTHTHSGAAGLSTTNKTILAGLESIYGNYNESYANYCAQQIEWSVYEAIQNMQESEMVAYHGELSLPQSERMVRDNDKNPNKSNESIPLTCMEFRFSCFQPILIYSMTYHPDMLGSANLSVSADLCYGIEQVLINNDKTPSRKSNENVSKDQYGMVLFLNGAAGNRSIKSNRSDDSFKEVKRLGKFIGLQMQAILSDEANRIPLLIDQSLPLIKIQQFSYPIPTMPRPSYSQAQNQLLLFERLLVKKNKEVSPLEWQRIRHIYMSYVEGAKIRAKMVESMSIAELTWQIMKLTIGGFTIVSIPGEISETLGNQMRLENGILAGYANGYYLVMVDDAGHENLDYESLMSPYMRGEGERFVSFINQVVLKENERSAA